MPEIGDPEMQVIRVRLPQRNEVLGIVQQRLGGSRMRVLCLDEKSGFAGYRVPFAQKFMGS